MLIEVLGLGSSYARTCANIGMLPLVRPLCRCVKVEQVLAVLGFESKHPQIRPLRAPWFLATSSDSAD